MESQVPSVPFHLSATPLLTPVGQIVATESASKQYTEERKAHCQTKKTKQREENSVIPVKFPENTIKDQDEKTQTSSRSRIDGDVVAKRTRRPRIEGKSKMIRLQKELQNIQK